MFSSFGLSICRLKTRLYRLILGTGLGNLIVDQLAGFKLLTFLTLPYDHFRTCRNSNVGHDPRAENHWLHDTAKNNNKKQEKLFN